VIWVGILGLLALAFVGNAMATPEQRSDARRGVKKFEKPALILTVVIWSLIIWSCVVDR
jgi:hypothetical protein